MLRKLNKRLTSQKTTPICLASLGQFQRYHPRSLPDLKLGAEGRGYKSPCQKETEVIQ